MSREVGYYWVLLEKSEEVAYWNGEEWIICGLEMKSNLFTDDHMKYICEEKIIRDKERFTCKGDYMKAVKAMDPRIKEMDSAIPLAVSQELSKLNIDYSMMVMAYWKNGEQEILDIAKHYCLLDKNK